MQISNTLQSVASWYNENSLRLYPFCDTATKASSVPTKLIVDLNLLIPSSHTNVWITNIKISPKLITLAIASDVSGLFLFNSAISNITPYKAYPLVPISSDCTGWVVFGEYKAVLEETYSFTSIDESLISLKAIKYIDPPVITGISKLGAKDDYKVQGMVKLTAGSDIEIKVHELLNNVVVFELKNPLKYVGPCNLLLDVDTNNPVTLHSISGVKPDSNGLLKILLK